MHVLRNFNLAVEHNGTKLWLAGVDDVLGHAANLSGALSGIPREGSCILLAHEPDYADVASGYPIDLQLSGHSHGGQVRLPRVCIGEDHYFAGSRRGKRSLLNQVGG